MVRYAFIFRDSFAITVEPFVVLDSNTGNEHGARIQVRRVEGAAEPGTQLAEPIWRGDLFRLTDGSPGNWDRAHYHPRFQGLQAGSRVTDPQLSRDPITWALAQLSDLHSLASSAAAPDLAAVSGELQPQVDGLREAIAVELESNHSAPRLIARGSASSAKRVSMTRLIRLLPWCVASPGPERVAAGRRPSHDNARHGLVRQAPWLHSLEFIERPKDRLCRQSASFRATHGVT
jgi:hypothetical protein